MIRASSRPLPTHVGKGLLHDQRGAGQFVTYLVLVMLALGCITAFTSLAKKVKDRFGEQTESVTTVSGPG